MDNNDDVLMQPLIKYIPILRDKPKNVSIKKFILDEKRLRGENKIKKCFICNLTTGNIQLKQLSSLSRCTDELIETHFICQNCDQS